MKVVADENIALVRDAFAGFGEIVTVPGRNITRELLEDATILLVRSVTQVNRELIEGTSIKFVASATIGVDHIDLKYLHENSIGFAYAPGSNAISVAEYVISALFYIYGKKKHSLQGLTLGIVGVGNIGSHLYHHAESLGIKCLLCDPPKKRLTGNDIYMPLDHLIANADVLTFHVPLITDGEDATYHMVNHEFIAKLRKNVLLINTSRGRVFDEKVVRAERDKFGGLVLDVWENEPSISIETLKACDIGTPHIAGYSFEGKLRGTQMIYDAACAFFFLKPIWKIPEAYMCDGGVEIDVSTSTFPLRDAIHGAYTIQKDSEKLNEISKMNKPEQAPYFDELRKTYPRRREFTYYKILCAKEQLRELSVLSDIGFRVEVLS
jgi:erythronate-4-phosphate dehydrogenase